MTGGPQLSGSDEARFAGKSRGRSAPDAKGPSTESKRKGKEKGKRKGKEEPPQGTRLIPFSSLALSSGSFLTKSHIPRVRA
jgi:hypothetical protein